MLDLYREVASEMNEAGFELPLPDEEHAPLTMPFDGVSLDTMTLESPRVLV
jgi:hypothetical protein